VGEAGAGYGERPAALVEQDDALAASDAADFVTSTHRS